MRTSASSASSAAQTASPLPASQQQAVQEAVQCVTVRLKPRLQANKVSSKGFAAPSNTSKEMLHMEIPTADQSPASVAQLVVDTAAALASSLGNSANPMLLVCGQPAVAAAAAGLKGRPAGLKVMELREACRAARLDGGLMVLAAPSVSDVALCQQLTNETWAGKAVVMLNAEFMGANPAGLGVPAELLTYVEQVLTVYCLMPVAVKGLLGNKEGMVLRKVTSKAGEPAPWRILMASGIEEQYLQIGQTKRRPSSDDLQLAFINANAAKSPLTQLASQFNKGNKKSS